MSTNFITRASEYRCFFNSVCIKELIYQSILMIQNNIMYCQDTSKAIRFYMDTKSRRSGYFSPQRRVCPGLSFFWITSPSKANVVVNSKKGVYFSSLVPYYVSFLNLNRRAPKENRLGKLIHNVCNQRNLRYEVQKQFGLLYNHPKVPFLKRQ